MIIAFWLMASGCKGRFINPITDICWSCLFPITVMGMNVTGGKDQEKYTTRICRCPGLPPKVGLPITFWEPSRLIDVTLKPFCLVGLGGLKIGDCDKTRRHGTVSNIDSTRHSFYQVHWYIYPVLYWLELLSNFQCIDKSTFDVGYMTEFDPFWNDDQWSFVMNPEGGFFSSPLAQAACAFDCMNTSVNTVNDKFFWCAGCEGSLYPFTGSVAHHEGGIQASSLLVARILAKFHRMMMLKGFNNNDFCQGEYKPYLQKVIYKYQLTYPLQSKCQPVGMSDALWGSGKSFPYDGEDFVYMLWIKRKCCLDGLMMAASGGAKM